MPGPFGAERPRRWWLVDPVGQFQAEQFTQGAGLVGMADQVAESLMAAALSCSHLTALLQPGDDHPDARRRIASQLNALADNLPAAAEVQPLIVPRDGANSASRSCKRCGATPLYSTGTDTTGTSPPAAAAIWAGDGASGDDTIAWRRSQLLGSRSRVATLHFR